MAPRIGYYADDFTGATDTLAVATRAGLRARLFLQTPTLEALRAAGELDVAGIAGVARSLPSEAMAAELLPAGRLFREAGVRILHYKCCSTFDSSVDKGNLGAATGLLRCCVDDPRLHIVGGQPNLGRYCLFGNLFAAFRIGGEVFRLDRHPTMRVHPVTPMQEADLRMHLARQGLERIASMPYPAYAEPLEAFGARLAALAADEDVLFDVSRESDLARIGGVLWDRARGGSVLALGASSVVQALAAHWGLVPAGASAIGPARGPVFVMSGSLSPVTAGQVAAASSYAHHALDASRVVPGADPDYVGTAIGSIGRDLAAGRHVLAHLGASPRDADLAPDRVAAGCGALVAGVLRRAPLRRIGVAGGDTSSYTLRALDIEALSYIGDVDAGAALCGAHAPGSVHEGLELMLKGGQMGGTDLFERLVAGTS